MDHFCSGLEPPRPLAHVHLSAVRHLNGTIYRRRNRDPSRAHLFWLRQSVKEQANLFSIVATYTTNSASDTVCFAKIFLQFNTQAATLFVIQELVVLCDALLTKFKRCSRPSFLACPETTTSSRLQSSRNDHFSFKADAHIISFALISLCLSTPHYYKALANLSASFWMSLMLYSKTTWGLHPVAFLRSIYYSIFVRSSTDRKLPHLVSTIYPASITTSATAPEAHKWPFLQAGYISQNIV